MQSAAMVSRDGAVDWLCLPRFDSDAVFAAMLGDKFNGQWRLNPTAEEGPPSRAGQVRRRYQKDTLILETEWTTAGGTVRVIDFMPPRSDSSPALVRIVEGVAGAVEMECVLRLRFGYGRIVPWVRRVDHAIWAAAGPDSVWIRTPVKMIGRGLAHRASFVVRAGERVPFVLSWAPSQHDDPPPPHRCRRGAQRDRRVLDRLGVALQLPRQVPGCGRPLADHDQGTDLRADRRHRRGADHVAARGSRRSAELGLPVLLAPGRDDRPRGAAQDRVLGRGGGLAALAGPRGGRDRGGRPDHVRGGGRAPADRVDRGLAVRLRGLRSGPDRQRCRPPGSVRRVRRGRGHHHARPAGRAQLRPALDQPDRSAAGLSRGSTGPSRTKASGRCAAVPGTSSTPR